MSDYPGYRNPGLAAALSAVIPGLGQLYNGRIGVGIVTLIVLAIGVAIIPYGEERVALGILIVLITWFAAVIGAYKYAAAVNRPRSEQWSRTRILQWRRILEGLDSRMGRESFEKWIEPLRLCSSPEGTLVIKAPNRFFTEWLKENYIEIIRDEAEKVLGRATELKLTVADEPQRDDTPNFKYTFANFVVGQRESKKAVGKKNMLYGALWCIGGTIVTAGSYAAARQAGRTYIIAFGAIIFGAIQFFRGLSQYVEE